MKVTGLGMGSLVFPACSRPVRVETLSAPIDAEMKRRLADAALNAATGAGATYADARIGRYLRQVVFTREDKVENIVNTESIGVGVRVIVGGTWGFAATGELDDQAVAQATRQAIAVARANARLQMEPVRLAPVSGLGCVSWATPIRRNAMQVPIREKVDLLMAANAAAMKAGASFVSSMIVMANDQKYFASTDGSHVDQDVHRMWPNFTVTAVDHKSGKFRSRSGLGAPVGMGWEYMEGRPEHKVRLPNGVLVYSDSYDMAEDAREAAGQAKEKLTARSVKPGTYDLVLDPTHLWLTIHESVGHALELDRVLGYEANFAGTSFATLDKWRSRSFRYGSPIVNFVADKVRPGLLATVGYDDEGVKTRRWDLVKDGILVNYEAIRDQVLLLGETASHGCAHADSWANVQFQRMPNVSLMPGKTGLRPEDVIGQVENGIYIIGEGSWSIDQQRLNFQFGGQLFFEIKNGKITEMLEDVAYQSRTPDFWNACAAVCDERDHRYSGSFFCGKGQPVQASPVSHGSSTALFKNITVINTNRSLG